MLAVIWIDWYAYHIARFRALNSHSLLAGKVAGIELVGGAGVHGSLVFRNAKHEGLPVTTLEPKRSWKDAGQSLLARRTWAKLNEIKPDVVLVPGYYNLPALASAIWARLRGKRAILMTESTRQDHRRKPLLEMVKGAVLRRLFHGAIAGGRRQTAYLKELGFSADRIARLYDVVDNDFFRREAEHWRGVGTPERFDLPANYFLYVGRLAPEKNLDGLINAFAEYRQQGGTWSLVLVGDGPLAGQLRELVRVHHLDDCVRFTGLKDTSELGPFYAYATWFILPSRREPWGLVANEAMAAGLPVILSDACGCADDLLEEDLNGYRLDPAQPAQLTRLMLRAGQLGEERRRQMGLRSAEIIGRYSPRLWAEEVIRIAGINTIISSRVA